MRRWGWVSSRTALSLSSRNTWCHAGWHVLIHQSFPHVVEFQPFDGSTPVHIFGFGLSELMQLFRWDSCFQFGNDQLTHLILFSQRTNMLWLASTSRSMKNAYCHVAQTSALNGRGQRSGGRNNRPTVLWSHSRLGRRFRFQFWSQLQSWRQHWRQRWCSRCRGRRNTLQTSTHIKSLLKNKSHWSLYHTSIIASPLVECSGWSSSNESGMMGEPVLVSGTIVSTSKDIQTDKLFNQN